MATIDQHIDAWKKRLLDLSRRNRLLYFRPDQSGTVPLLRPDASTLFTELVIHDRTFEFYVPPEEPEESSESNEQVHGIGTEVGQLSSPRPRAEHPGRQPRPNEIVTGLDRKQLRRLDRIRQRARTSLAEQGINTLFVAFGLLHWVENRGATTHEQDLVQSPLFLVPVELVRRSVLDPYQLVALDDDIEFNPTLVYKLQHDFGLTLSAPSGTIDDQSLEALLDTIRAQVRRFPTWKVTNEAYLGIFSFTKLRMYEDLVDHEDKIKSHPILLGLMGKELDFSAELSALPTAERLDDELHPRDTFHVLNADASQVEAIEAAKRGLSFVLQGPPGTGKSQTIANIIAESLRQGKRILFVSEKMAALEVVKRRLDQTGLGTFCLEVHSHRANKRAVLDQLGQALDYNPPIPRPDLEQQLSLLQSRRRQLNTYVRNLHRLHTPLQMSAFDILGQVARRIDVPDIRFTVPNLESMDISAFNAQRDAVRNLVRYGHVVLNETDHPWSSTRLTSASQQVQADVRAHFTRAISLLRQLDEIGSQVASTLGLSAPRTLHELRRVHYVAVRARETLRPPAAWIAPSAIQAARSTAKTWQERTADHLQRRAGIESRYLPAVFSGDVGHWTMALDSIRTLSSPLGALNPDQALDTVVTQRATLHAALQAFESGVSRLERATRQVAPLLGIPVPSTLEAARNLVSIAAVVSADPRPTPAWFEAGALEQLRDLASRAATHSAAIQSGIQALSRHTEEIFEVVSEDIAEAYAGEFRSVFRRLGPRYWKVHRSIGKTLQVPGKLSFDAAAKAVAAARTVQVARDWFHEHSNVLRQQFGTHFLGENTDWSTLMGALTAVESLVTRFAPEGVPTALRDTLLESGSRVTTIRVWYQQAAEALQQVDDALVTLASIADMSVLLPDEQPPQVVPLSSLDAIRQWHGALKDLWKVVDEIASLRQDGRYPGAGALLNDLFELRRVHASEEEIQAHEAVLRQQFGKRFKGFETDWNDILSALDWTERLLDVLPPFEWSSTFRDQVCEGGSAAPPLAELEPRLSDLLARWEGEVEYLATIFPVDSLRFPDQPIQNAFFPDLIQWFETRLESIEELATWVGSRNAIAVCDAAGISSFVDAVRREQLDPSSWLAAYEKRFYLGWLEAIERANPEIGAFNPEQFEAIIAEFRALDRAMIEKAPLRIIAEVDARRPKRETLSEFQPQGEARLLLRELEKRRAHKPLRWLFARIPNLLLALKPCLMMSPLSVSYYLDSDVFRFDLVIFDEASQVRPEEAVGAILRGQQLIVVGDSRQLPPSNFFDVSLDPSAEDEWVDEAGTLESILDELASAGLPQRMLQWHYRSRHEDLIAFSNHHFYDGRLVTFPSADDGHGERGVIFDYVPGGKYRRRSERDNPLEARRVAERVIEHARRHPHKSLGVVALNSAQQEQIQEQVDKLRVLNPDLEPFFAEDRAEPFFIKNLEAVQGDERDVIFISVGYADELGRDVPIPLNFGPLNRAGGERRLNVLITRAREQVRVVSSIRAHQIDWSRSQSRGVRLLHDYLRYAEEGSATLGAELYQSGISCESPFEEAVAKALTEKGLIVRPQVGCSGYRIDLAIEDPERPGTYLLGIECDGATYHSSRTARDRDRLRQEVLESLGWRIHRVWSPNWVRNPQQEIKRILAAVNDARRSRDDRALTRATPIVNRAPVPRTSGSEPDDAVVDVAAAPRLLRAQPYVSADLPSRSGHDLLLSLPDGIIIDVLRKLVEQEGPIHRDRAIRSLARCWGYERVGARVHKRLSQTIRSAHRNGHVVVRGQFLWSPTMSHDPYDGPVREVGPRQIYEVAIEELAAAIVAVASAHRITDLDTLVQETRAFLGLGRTGKIVNTAIRNAAHYLLERGRLRTEDGRVTPTADPRNRQAR